MNTSRIALVLLGWLATSGCSSSPTSRSTWLAADVEERGVQLERQLRGFDVAMMEVGHRYIDLYWAGRDANWGAAAYQLGKIRLAIENGLERRPKRARSAQAFLAGPLPAMDEAVEAQDSELFDVRFQQLTLGCNACHEDEAVPFFEIRPPASRVSPIHRGGGAD